MPALNYSAPADHQDSISRAFGWPDRLFGWPNTANFMPNLSVGLMQRRSPALVPDRIIYALVNDCIVNLGHWPEFFQALIENDPEALSTAGCTAADGFLATLLNGSSKQIFDSPLLHCCCSHLFKQSEIMPLSGMDGDCLKAAKTAVIHVAANVQIASSGHTQATVRSLYAAGTFARGGEAGATLFVSANGLQVSSVEYPTLLLVLMLQSHAR